VELQAHTDNAIVAMTGIFQMNFIKQFLMSNQTKAWLLLLLVIFWLMQ
jgi:hypothetical protein